MNFPDNEYNRFDSDLRHTLNDYEVPFDPNDWALMEEQLRRKNGGIVPFLNRYKWIMATALVLLLATWQLKNRLSAPEPNITFTQQQTPPPPAPSVVNSTTLPTPNEASNNKALPNAHIGKDPAQFAMPTSLRQSTSKKANGLATTRKKVANPPTDKATYMMATAAPDALLSANNSITQGSDITNMATSVIASTHRSTSIKEQNNNDLSNNSTITNTLPAPTATATSPAPADNAVKTDLPAAIAENNPPKTAKFDGASPLIETATPNNTSANSSKEEVATNDKTTTAIEPSTTKKYPAIKKPKKRVAAFYAMPTASVDGNFLNGRPLRLGTSAGIAFNYQFHRYFSIETGVSYTQKNFQMTTVLDKYQPVFPEQYRAEFSRMSFIEIPFVIKFHLPAYSDECLPYIGIGNSIFVPIEKRYTYSLIEPPATLIEGMNPAYYNPEPPAEVDPDPEIIWRTIHLKAGAGFKLNKKLRLNIESQFKASLDALPLGENNPIIEKNGLKYNLYSFGIQTGLSYRF